MFGMIKGGTLNLLSTTTMPEQMAFSYMRSYLFRAFYLRKKGDLRCPFLLE
jgi:hypothetical protein